MVVGPKVVVGAGVGRKLGNLGGLLDFKSDPKVFLLPNFNLSLKPNFDLEVVSGGVTGSVEPLLMVVLVSVVLVVVGVVLIILKDKSLGCKAPNRFLLKGNLKPLGKPGNPDFFSGILALIFSSITFSNGSSVVKLTTLIDDAF